VKLNPSPRLGQAISGSLLLGIAVTAGATGLYLNVNHGLQVSVAAGTLFGLADLTKIVLPIVAGAVGWSKQMKLTAVICVAVSLWCASSAYLGQAGQTIATKQHGADQYTIVKAEVAKLEADVTRFDAQAAAEAKNGGCGKQCRFLTDRADKARQSLTEARTTLKAATPVALSGYEKISSAVTAGLFLFLVEALVWLSVPAMAALRQAMAAPVVTTVAPAKAATRSATKKTKKAAAKAKAWSQKKTNDLLAQALKKPDRRRKGMKIRNDNFVTAND
jgi:hypothetical protein